MSNNNKSNNNNNKNFKDTLALIIIIAFVVIFAFSSCSSAGNKYDVAHDPDGFLGYSDDYWEWQSKQ